MEDLLRWAPVIKRHIASVDDVTRAVSQLSKEDQLLIRYHYQDELNFVEVGKKLGVSTSAAHYRVQRAARVDLERVLLMET